jgi:hypothetical protein
VARREAQKVSARQAKIAAIRAEEERRRRRLLLSLAAIGAVVVVVVALVVVKLTTDTSSSPSAQPGAASPASRQVVDAVAAIPASVFDKVSAGGGTRPPQPIRAAPPLTAGGKPRVLYVGAEYCPYCAAERWAVVAALSRFGTFHDLGVTTSSSQDVYPSTATLSFHGATYTSKYLSFSGYETQSNKLQGSSYAPLDKLPAADKRIFQTYDAPPYVPAQSAGSIPFVDLGGRYMISGASYDPGVLKSMNHLQIARALSDPTSPVAQNVDATANLVTAALCNLTHDQPGSVCTSAGVTAAAQKLGEA